MKLKIILLFFLSFCCFSLYGQDFSDKMGQILSDENLVDSYYDNYNKNTVYVKLYWIGFDINKDKTYLEIVLHKVGGKDRIDFVPRIGAVNSLGSHVALTRIELCDNSIEGYSNLEYVCKFNFLDLTTRSIERYGWNVKDNEEIAQMLVFDRLLPPGTKKIRFLITIDMKNPDGSILHHTCEFYTDGFSLEEAFNHKDVWGYEFPLTSNWTEESIRQFAKTHNDGICGIYEGINGEKYKLGCIKENGEYKFIYLNGVHENCWWHPSDVKARLRSSATKGLFKADWLMLFRYVNSDVYVNFNGATMDVFINGGKDSYLKMYPPIGNNNASSSTNNNIYEPPFYAKWSGSGFALNNGYICTNHHVIDGANNIKIYGVKGNFNIGYNARVVLSDSHNDLAVLKINDSRFSGFGTIPYRVKTNMAEVGESCFVLGYPMTATMGDEIKLTTGVVSAKSGFQGDLSLYQISAPIQPGNSGGPLFDNNGNLIGIVNSKHTGAENVGYAIKASYLSNLIQSGSLSGLLPQSNTISGQNLSGKVKSVKNYVYLIKCN